jgi:uncharacterized metal-binding protein
MPSGKTHDKISWLFLPIVVWGAYSWRISEGEAVSAVSMVCLLLGYLLGSFYLTPDLDTHSQPYRRWGMFRWVWLPYQRVVSHRSWISHGVIVGPFVQCLYVMVVLAITGLSLMTAFHYLTLFDPSPAFQHPVWTEHAITDIPHFWSQLVSKAKRFWQQGGQAFAEQHQTELFSVFVGLCIGSFIHIASDAIFSSIKNWGRFFTFRKPSRLKRKSS